jgi:5-methyltetrahydropteroyltriglutamate--homocysteine methyltransferase
MLSSEEAFALDLGRALNFELKELARNGATELQIDEPYSPASRGSSLGRQSRQRGGRGVDAHVTLHICYGNRYGKPSFEGSYRYLFRRSSRPESTPCRSNSRAEARKTSSSSRFKAPFTLGLGVIDVKTQEIEPPALVADRIRRALEVVPAERLVINPDCGCVHLPRDVAFNKLVAMVEGTRIVRAELGKYPAGLKGSPYDGCRLALSGPATTIYEISARHRP